MQEVPVVSNAFQSPSGEISIFINSKSDSFKLVTRPVNPCADEFAAMTCPSLICEGQNYEDVKCGCYTPEVGRVDKYNPICR